jgi:hypothetical protein
MSIAQDIATARALLEKAEREWDPELKAHALDEALALLSSCDPGETSESERRLIANLRAAHTRRLLAQLVSLTSVSMDAWFDYARLLFGELKDEVEPLIGQDPQLRKNYERFIKLWGPQVAEILQKQQTDPS